MSGLEQTFESCRQEKRSAFIPYLIAGDPDLPRSAELLHALAAAGADGIGLGVAFSDPMADGPVIQHATRRALASGGTMSAALRLVARHRAELAIPVVFFTYFNPIHARGLTRFAEQAASSGVDAVLCIDLPPEEGERELAPALRERGVEMGYLLAPTSTRRRVREVSTASSGFVFCASRGGVSGLSKSLPRYLLKQAKRLRRRIDLPLAVGFGASTPKQVGRVAKVADAVVLGSVLVRAIERNVDSPDLVRRVEERARALRDGIE